MSGLYNAGMCFLILSVWAIIQLTFMGVFYNMEAFTLLEDVHPETFKDDYDAIDQMRKSFKAVARNCWIAAGMYCGLFLISGMLVFKARRNMKRAAFMSEDEPFCNPDFKANTKPPKEKQRKA